MLDSKASVIDKEERPEVGPFRRPLEGLCNQPAIHCFRAQLPLNLGPALEQKAIGQSVTTQCLLEERRGAGQRYNSPAHGLCGLRTVLGLGC
jgi:hypothetical protein